MTPEVIARIAEQIHAPMPAARATYDGRPGHPVLIKRQLFSAIGGLEGDRGARDLLRDVGAAAIECGHLASALDVDTRLDLESAEGEIRAGAR